MATLFKDGIKENTHPLNVLEGVSEQWKFPEEFYFTTIPITKEENVWLPIVSSLQI